MTYQYDNRAYQPRDAHMGYQPSKFKYGDNYLEQGGRASSMNAEDDSVFEGDDARPVARMRPQPQYSYGAGYRVGLADSRAKRLEGLNPSQDRPQHYNIGPVSPPGLPGISRTRDSAYTGSGPSYELQRIPAARSLPGSGSQLKSPQYSEDSALEPEAEQSTLSSKGQTTESSTRDDIDINRSQKWPDTHPTPRQPLRTVQLAQLIRESLDPKHQPDVYSPTEYPSREVLSPTSVVSKASNDDRKSLALHRDARDHNPDLSRLDPNRSILSGEYRVNRPTTTTPTSRCHTNSFTDHHNRSGSSTKESYTEQSAMGSLKRDPLTHRKLNGAAQPVRENGAGSRRSVSLSHVSLNRHPSKLILYGHGYGVQNSLVSLIVVAVVCLLLVMIALMLTFRVSESEFDVEKITHPVIGDAATKHVRRVCFCVCIFTIMLDTCCLMVCCLQCYLAAKLLKCPQGEERAFKYLKECNSTRFIAITGFFLSIPLLLVALLLYILLEFHTTGIVSTIFLSVGILFCIFVMVHNSYRWQIHKNEANLNIPPFEHPKHQPEPASHSELSTLV